MIAKVFPVVFDNTQIPPEIHDIIARTVAPEHMHVAVLVAVCSLLPLIFAIRGIGSFFNVYWISIVSMKVLEEIRLDAFSRLQTLPLSFIDRQKRGDLISRLLNDAAGVQSGLVVAANDIIKAAPYAAGRAGISRLPGLCQSAYGHRAAESRADCPGGVAHPLFGRRIMKKAKLAQEELGRHHRRRAGKTWRRSVEIRSYGMQEQQVGLFLGLIQRFFQINLRTVKYRHFLVPVLKS